MVEWKYSKSHAVKGYVTEFRSKTVKGKLIVQIKKNGKWILLKKKRVFRV